MGIFFVVVTVSHSRSRWLFLAPVLSFFAISNYTDIKLSTKFLVK